MGTATASANIPLVTDELALGVSAFDRLDPGYMDNVKTGQTNTNTTRVQGGRATLRFTPTDRLDIQLNASYQDIRNNALAGEDLNPTTLQLLQGEYKYSQFVNSSLDTPFVIGNLTATYRLDAGTITDARARRRRLLRQGPLESGPFGRLRGALGCQNVVAAGLARRCAVQVAYAIGVTQPVSIVVDAPGDKNCAARLRATYALAGTALRNRRQIP